MIAWTALVYLPGPEIPQRLFLCTERARCRSPISAVPAHGSTPNWDTSGARLKHPGSNTDNIELPGGTGDLLKCRDAR